MTIAVVIVVCVITLLGIGLNIWVSRNIKKLNRDITEVNRKLSKVSYISNEDR